MPRACPQDPEELSESVASFASQAAVKLRKHGLLASGCNIYAQLAKPGMFEDAEGWDANFVSETVMFPEPTDATNRMLKAISDGVEALWVPGARYGRGKVFSASEGIVREWKMKRSLLSKRPTTSWSELFTVR